MSVKNPKREEPEYIVAPLLGTTQETLKKLRDENRLPRDCYRLKSKCVTCERYVYDVEKTRLVIEEMRRNGELRKSKKRRQV